MVLPLRSVIVAAIILVWSILIGLLLIVSALVRLFKLVELVELIVQELQSIYILGLNDQRCLSNLFWVYNLVHFVLASGSTLWLIALFSSPFGLHRRYPSREITLVWIVNPILILMVIDFVSRILWLFRIGPVSSSSKLADPFDTLCLVLETLLGPSLEIILVAETRSSSISPSWRQSTSTCLWSWALPCRIHVPHRCLEL